MMIRSDLCVEHWLFVRQQSHWIITINDKINVISLILIWYLIFPTDTLQQNIEITDLKPFLCWWKYKTFAQYYMGSTLSLDKCLSFGQVNQSFTCPSKKSYLSGAKNVLNVNVIHSEAIVSSLLWGLILISIFVIFALNWFLGHFLTLWRAIFS